MQVGFVPHAAHVSVPRNPGKPVDTPFHAGEQQMRPTTADRHSPLRPDGEGKGGWLATLEQGANLLQDTAPLQGFDARSAGSSSNSHIHSTASTT